MTKIYFCSDCSIMLPLKNEPEDGDKCENCNCDLFEVKSISGQFEDSDAKHLMDSFNE